MRRTCSRPFLIFVLAIFWTSTILADDSEPAPPNTEWSIRILYGFHLDPVLASVDHLSDQFGPKYPNAEEFRRKLTSLDSQRHQLFETFDSNDPKSRRRAVSLAGSLHSLRRRALLENPLLRFDRLLLVKRAYQLPPNKFSKGKPRSPKNDRRWSYVERLEGDALGLPVNHNSIFSIRRSGYDNQIAVLEPVHPNGKLSTFYRPDGDTFVGEVDLDFDGSRLLFTMPQSDRWQVFQVDADGDGLVRITPDEDHDVDNYDACYLPDGRIVYCSTAGYQSVPCWNGLHNVAGLYLLDPSAGSNSRPIRQLTFDQDDDNYPAVLNNGRIIFTRWEYANVPHFFGRLLFSMNPDGSDQREYYGSNSYWPNAVYFARPVPGHPSKVAGIVSGHHGDYRMGNLVILDPAKGRHRDDGLVFRVPADWHQHIDRKNRYPKGARQPLGYNRQSEPVLRDRLTSEDWPKFLHPFPLSENYILASAKPSPESNWGIYLVDTFGNLTLIREEPGYALLEPTPFRSIERPPAVPDRVNLDRDQGVVYLQDVYTGPGLAGIPRGTVKSLRVLSYDFGYRGMSGFDKIGIDGPWDVMRILGTVPVEEDGSAVFNVPANRPISVQPLDEKHRAVQLMRSWFTVMPGEVKSCVGCHESQNTGPPSRYGQAQTQRPADITPWYGPPRGFDFSREVQPVLDKYCVACHDGEKTKLGGRNKPDLRSLTLRPDYQGILTNVPAWYDPENLPHEWDAKLMRQGRRVHHPILFTPAYEALIAHVRRTGPEGDYHLLDPTDYYADTSPLVRMLEKGHHGVQLNDEAWDRLATWIDLNVPCHGTWSEALPIPFDGARRKRELTRKYTGLDSNPEAIPKIPHRPVKPIPPKKVEVVTGQTKAAGWPFDRHEARMRQLAASAEIRRTVDLGQDLTMDLVLIPAGEFIIGNAYDGADDEWPQARVRIERPFWLAAREVTNRQFALFDPRHDSRFARSQKMNVHARGYPLNEPRQPVVRVSWRQANAFCHWLSERTGMSFTLPTEPQWEYACRAGSHLPMWYGWFTDDFSERANLADETILGFSKYAASALNQIYDGWMPFVAGQDDGALVTTEVGRYVPNPWGLFDMHGNAAEWTSTLYRKYPYDPADGREDTNAEGARVVRGGSWCDLPYSSTASYRFGYAPWRKVHNVGFRVVMADKSP